MTVVPSSDTTQTLATDTLYQVEPGTIITSSARDAIVINGIAPVTMTNAGTITSSSDSAASAVRFNAIGSLVNLAAGKLLGNTYGILMQSGADGNVQNQGDVSARAGYAIAYYNGSGGIVDNFGTLNGAPSVGPGSNGVFIQTSGNVVVNNHSGGVIRSGTSDAVAGAGVWAVSGGLTVNNDGMIDGYHEGVNASAQSASIVNSSTGTIRGNIAPGVTLGPVGVLDNNGVISSATQAAVFMTGGNGAVTLGTGSSLNGAGGIDILSAAPGNTITLTGSGTETGSFSAASASVGYAALTASAASNWTLGGSVLMASQPSAAVRIDGALTLADTLTNDAGSTTVSPGGVLMLGTGGAGGSVTGNVRNDGTLSFNRSDAYAYNGTLSGDGTLLQIGSGRTVLTGAGSSQGTVWVNAGALELAQAGAFNAASYVTQTGAATIIGGNSTLDVATGLTQQPGSALIVGLQTMQPVITASSGALNGALLIDGFGPSAPNTASALLDTSFNIIHVTGATGMTGDFDRVFFNGPSPVDYLIPRGAKTVDGRDYDVRLALTWRAGAAQGNGTFTLADAASTFNVDIPLADQSGPFASGWDGRSLTKNGAGRLILSAANGYTGGTLINEGTLQTGAANALMNSSNVSVGRSATFELGNLPQQVNNLSGGGRVLLGGADLTVQSLADSEYDGVVSGSGHVVKTGAGTFTLGGSNVYLGGTNVLAGTLVAKNAASLGSGPVVNDSTLRLDFARFGIVTNAFLGPGALVKTGRATAVLVAPGSSQGSVSVDAGTLSFLRTGRFTTTGDFATAPGASTLISARSQLAVGGHFAMNGTLDTFASDAPPVGASTASIGPNAVFNLAGYSAPATTAATDLASGVFTVVRTATPGGLTGAFSAMRIGGSPVTPDYLTMTGVYTPQTFSVAVAPTWYAGLSGTPARANGVFTLPDAQDSFDMDIVLADQAANAATGWDGKTLTKAGAGTLQLSKANRYTGATSITGGTLAAGAADVIANSAQLNVGAGATFDLGGYTQHVNNLTGSGSIALGGGDLSANSTVDTTFGGVIGGPGNVTKTGAGALTLAGDNTFAGNTIIAGGTLRLGAGGTSGSVAGDIVNNGALVFDRSDNVTYGGAISGSGDVVQQGKGAVTLTQTHTYTGNTAVDAGALILGAGARLANTRQVSIAPGATFGGYGSVGGDVVNNGLFAIADAAPGFANAAPGQFAVGGTLTNNGEIRMASVMPASALAVNGNYAGNNGLLALSTVLAGDGSATDRLIVHGDTSGQTRVRVTNAGGAGAPTSKGIEIVQVDGQSSGVFSLDKRVVAGPYEYVLQQGGGDWYLRALSDGPAPAPRPEPGAYLGNQQAAVGMFTMTMHDRTGFADPFATQTDGGAHTAWARTRGAHVDSEAAGGRIGESTDTAIVHAGIDVLNRVRDGHRWQLGVMAGYGSSTTNTSARNIDAHARGTTNGLSGGLYATWRGNAYSASGPYVDTWLQYGHFDNTVKGNSLAGEDYTSRVWSGSVEGGWAFPVRPTSKGVVLFEPQLQLVYTNFHADDHTENTGTVISGQNGGNWTTRLGVRLFHAPISANLPGWLPFVEVNWLHDTHVASVALNGFGVSQDGPKNRFEAKIGAQGLIGRQWRVWGNLGYQQGAGGYHAYEGLLGAKYVW
ncbi:autotransporter outer membrane beta-barrel domain-containing protein [Caballeronia sp. LZ062]|uniref:autotransporter outer membrane beta-barrel domain-containing protein n=1 Tax=unclassified Caballeronia TaxID=2646786 RepID=UPI00285F6292|nr:MULTISPECIES: autotransporter outer membrane beta-barrel domain-containing protein [unclassified Caballeronia]MDR5853835.1 autotransporter outer membrane beta-barrel domain-containing protein [Caballeronia sp. LZ050]MDR5871634.1 autotransporter outer membrane beta-barrel domain-containing protein [Caballeronia sp. LZ062]